VTALFEAVPNFSEGRDASVVRSIADAARGLDGVAVLDVEMNADHHRSVISLAGPSASLSEALFRMVRVAVERIDLNRHHGEHPRMGAADVVPFVPLGDTPMREAVALAERLGERLWRELHLPVYLYAEAARRPERRDLAVVRKGGFEGIRDAIATDPARRPDFGDPAVHPTAGIVAVGARPVLIAYNAYLAANDLAVAKQVARAVRARDGGLPEVKALGFEIQERHQVQVSMNLTDYHVTPVHAALEAVRREALQRGTRVASSEIVGLVPEDALVDAAQHYLGLDGFDRSNILERKLRDATRPDPNRLAGRALDEFAEKLAARTPTPGGGSAAAAAGAFGAALGEMVVLYSQPPGASASALSELGAWLAGARRAFLDGVDDDSRAYEELRSARRALKAAPDDPAARTRLATAVARAAEVPLETARRARLTARRLAEAKDGLKAALGSDLTTALALLDAAAVGALANATINLPDLERAGLPTEAIRAEIAALGARPG
jgi:glutamate formiminotransferase / formiminotetrahydrofolate cyclodeaminase